MEYIYHHQTSPRTPPHPLRPTHTTPGPLTAHPKWTLNPTTNTTHQLHVQIITRLVLANSKLTDPIHKIQHPAGRLQSDMTCSYRMMKILWIKTLGWVKRHYTACAAYGQGIQKLPYLLGTSICYQFLYYSVLRNFRLISKVDME